MGNAKVAYGLAGLSALVGLLLLLACGLLIDELRPSMKFCNTKPDYRIPEKGKYCNPIVANVASSGFAIIAASIQIIITIIVFVKKGEKVDKIMMGSLLACFIVTVTAFSVSIHNDRSDSIKGLKLMGEIKSKFLFYYSAVAIDWIFCLVAGVAANRLL